MRSGLGLTVRYSAVGLGVNSALQCGWGYDDGWDLGQNQLKDWPRFVMDQTSLGMRGR
jgi:hypothetical protein